MSALPAAAPKDLAASGSRRGLLSPTLEIVPAIYSLWRGRQVTWIKGPQPPRKKWAHLNRQFIVWERSIHERNAAAPKL